ncbi:MAG: PKD domain-containing protein [Syntrophaceae bacterium]
MRTMNVLAMIVIIIVLFGCGGGGGGGGSDSADKVSPEENTKLPVADAGPNQTVYEGELVTLDGSNSNGANAGIMAYVWSQVSGNPSVTLSNANAVSPTFIAPQLATNSTVLVFKLTITDMDNQQSSQECSVTVNKVNQMPKAVTGPTQTVTAGSIVTLDGSNSSDADDGIASYAWSQTGGISVSLSGATTSKPTFTAPSSATALTFVLTVTDKAGQASTATCVVNVTSVVNPNQAPTANAGTDQTVVEGAVVNLNGANSTDADGSIVSYAWLQTGGSTTVTLVNANTATPTFTAPDPGVSTLSLTFQLTVTDDDGSIGTDTCTVNITVSNDPPTADAGVDQNVAEYATVTLNGSASTDDNGIALYSWCQTSGPSVTLSSATAAKPTFTAPAYGSTALVFELTVTDAGNLSATDTCIVNVTSRNLPTANAGPDQSVEEGATVTLDGSSSSDVTGGTIVNYAWVQTAGATVTLANANNAICSFTAPDPGSSAASFTFRLTVTDNEGLSATDTCTITVTPINTNNPPTANAGADQSVAEGTSVTLNGSASTDDAGIASYSWSQTSGTAVTLLNSNTATPSFTAPQITVSSTALVFTLTVTDTGGLTATDTCTVTVTGDNDPPTANAGADQSVVEGTTVTLSGSGSDPENETLTYAWTQTGGTSVTLSNAAAAIPTFTAPSLGLAGTATLTFQLTTTDSGGLKASDTCVVTVGRSATHMAQDSIFTAYAGIGYMKRDTLTDNEVLHNIMVDNINALVTELADATVANDSSRNTKLYNYYWFGTPQTFTYNTTGLKSTVYMVKGALVDGWREYTLTVSLDFNANGYTYRTCKYTGTSGVTDVTATIKGYSKTTSLIFFTYDSIFRSVDINVANTFTAQYSGAAVTFNDWNIAYTVTHGSYDPSSTYRSSSPLNVYMIPEERRAYSGEQVDNRDYTLGGSFKINGNTYYVTDGFRYLQQQINYVVNSTTTTRLLVSIAGSLRVPGMSSVVTIATPYSTTDPVGTKTIYKLGTGSTNTGIWEAGQMSVTGNLGGTTTTQTASFTSGTAAFSGGLGSWTVTSWQDALAPF